MASDAELGSASVDIDVLRAPLRKHLADARGMVDGEMSKAGDSGGRSLAARLASSVGRGMASIAKITAVTAGAGVIALGGIGYAGAKAGLQTASAMEQAQVSFTTMLGSAKKADAFLGKLGQFAAKTPFEFPELQTAASSLVSAGINANKVIPIMTSLGNATAGMGTGSEGIKRATVALQQMSAAGKISGEDLNQLRDAGVPVFDLLAKATGKSVKEVANLAAKGKLGSKELGQLMKALESGKGLERFNGLMAAQSNTLSGQLSTLKDTVSMGLANAVKPWLPTIKAGLGKVSAAAAPFFTWLAAKSAEMAKNGPAMLDKLSAAVAKVRPIFDAVRTSVSGFIAGLQGKGPIDGFAGSMNTAGLGVSALIAAFKDGDVTSDGFVGKMETVGVALRGIKDAVAEAFSSMKAGDASSAGASLGSMADSAAQLTPLVTQLAGSIPSLNDVLSVGATVLKYAADHTELLSKAMPLLIGGLIAFKVSQLAANAVAAASLPTKIAEVVVNRQLVASNKALIASRQGVTAAVAASTTVENVSILTRARGTVVTIAKTVAERAAALATRAYAAGQWLLNAALTANPIGLIIIALIALGAAVVFAWKHSETFRNIVLGAWSAIQVGVGAAIGWLKVAVPAVFSWIKSSFLRYTPLGIVLSHWGQIRAVIAATVGAVRATIGWFAGLPGKFAGWFGAAKTAANNKLTEVVTLARSIPGRILSALGNVGTHLKDAGAKLIQGLADGILGRIRAVTDAAGRVAQKIKDFFPGSPVKEGPLTSWNNGRAGSRLGGMLASGLDASRARVAAASLRLAAAAVSPMGLSSAGVSLAGGGSSPVSGMGARLLGAPTPPPAPGGGATVKQYIYPQPGQSEQEIGTVAGNRVLFALGSGAR